MSHATFGAGSNERSVLNVGVNPSNNYDLADADSWGWVTYHILYHWGDEAIHDYHLC